VRNATFYRFAVKQHRSTSYMRPTAITAASSVTLVSPAKTEEPIESRLGCGLRGGSKDHALDAGPDCRSRTGRGSVFTLIKLSFYHCCK